MVDEINIVAQVAQCFQVYEKTVCRLISADRLIISCFRKDNLSLHIVK